MKLRLNMDDFEEIILEFGSFHTMDEGEFIKENNFEFDYSAVKGAYKEIVLENIRIGYGSSTLASSFAMDFEFPSETVEMHFTLNGTSLTTIDGSVKDFSISKNEHNLFYCKNITGQLLWKSNSMHVFEVNIKPNFFENLLPDHKLFDQFKKMIQDQQTGYLNRFNFPILPHMHLIINEIINCNRKGLYKKMFLEAKVMELLLLQLEQIQEYTSDHNTMITKSETEKMHFAKDLILEHLKSPLSLNMLAKELNTNEFSLKKNFKIIFGTTVFGYIQDLKMGQAKQLILEQDMPINQVADLIGYKNPQHFSFAFKKKFGVSPSILRK